MSVGRGSDGQTAKFIEKGPKLLNQIKLLVLWVAIDHVGSILNPT